MLIAHHSASGPQPAKHLTNGTKKLALLINENLLIIINAYFVVWEVGKIFTLTYLFCGVNRFLIIAKLACFVFFCWCNQME